MKPNRAGSGQPQQTPQTSQTQHSSTATTRAIGGASHAVDASQTASPRVGGSSGGQTPAPGLASRSVQQAKQKLSRQERRRLERERKKHPQAAEGGRAASRAGSEAAPTGRIIAPAARDADVIIPLNAPEAVRSSTPPTDADAVAKAELKAEGLTEADMQEAFLTTYGRDVMRQAANMKISPVLEANPYLDLFNRCRQITPNVKFSDNAAKSMLVLLRGLVGSENVKLVVEEMTQQKIPISAYSCNDLIKRCFDLRLAVAAGNSQWVAEAAAYGKALVADADKFSQLPALGKTSIPGTKDELIRSGERIRKLLGALGRGGRHLITDDEYKEVIGFCVKIAIDDIRLRGQAERFDLLHELEKTKKIRDRAVSKLGKRYGATTLALAINSMQRQGLPLKKGRFKVLAEKCKTARLFLISQGAPTFAAEARELLSKGFPVILSLAENPLNAPPAKTVKRTWTRLKRPS